MIAVVYASRATRSLDQSELRALLGQAREANAERGVSGMLLHVHGSFLQLIEGPEAAVDGLFDRIRADRRHGDLRLLGRTSIDARSFDGWAMGFDEPHDEDLASALPGYKAATRYPLVDADLVHDAGVARTLLRLYASNP